MLFVFSGLVFYPSIVWVGKAFWGLYDMLNLLLLTGIVALFLVNKSQGTINFQNEVPRIKYHLIPFILTIAALPLWAVFQFIVQINLLAACAMFLYLFGLYGLYVRPERWHTSIIPFLLITMTLPFGSIMDVYIGFPLRIFAVDSLADMFSFLGFQHITNDTILVVDNSATQIDYSCSGLKGIWSALLFFFTLTWIQSIRVDYKWIMVLALMMLLMLSSNLIRIACIVLLSSVYGLPEIADLIHAPLGLIGYIFSCTIIYGITQLQIFRRVNDQLVPKTIHIPRYNKIYNRSVHPRMIVVLFAMLIFVLCIPLPVSIQQIPMDVVDFPADWCIQPMKLSADETEFFDEQMSSAVKFTFSYKSICGSVLISKSVQWRGHHNPEFCIRAGGNRIDKLETLRLSDSLSVKWMTVNTDAHACYWFQSPSQCTDDYGTRVWAEIRNKEKNWILISVVFDSFGERNLTEIRGIIEEMNILITQMQ